MVFKSALKRSLDSIILSDLEDRENFSNKITELNNIEKNDDSYNPKGGAYLYYTLNYYNKFRALENEVKRENRPLEAEVYDNLLFFLKKTLIYGKKTFYEYKNRESFSYNRNPRLLHGIIGNLYFWLGKFIIKGGRVKNLVDILEKKESYVTGDNRHLIMALFEEAIKNYEMSREFGNMEKENDSKIGVSYVELASLSNKPIEKYENLLKGIMNLEMSRRNGNKHIMNDEYIATSYQEMGNLISSLDLLLNPGESRRIVEIKEDIYNETKGYVDCFELLRGLNISEDSRFNKSDIEGTAIAFFMQSLKEYDNIREKKGKSISAEDYTYRGKCALRLSKLNPFPKHIKMAIDDFENASKLRKDQFIYSFLGEAHFVLAHNYLHYDSSEDSEEKTKEFRRATLCYIKSNRMGNTKQEVYGMIAESYRHLSKIEFRKKDLNPNLFERYLKNSIKYAKKAISMEGK